MRSLLSFLLVTIILVSCNNMKENVENPFLSDYNTPYGVPPFDKIRTEHYIPAIEEGMRQQNLEIEAIVSNSEEANFDNTILALDRSGELLTQVNLVFENLSIAESNDEIEEAARLIIPMLTNHSDNIILNEALFSRIKTVYEKRFDLGLNKSQIRVVEKYFDDFKRNGADLSEEERVVLRDLNQKLSTLALQFGENNRAETNSNFKVIIENKDELVGLTDEIIEAAAIAAKEDGLDGKWIFTLQKPSWIPFLQYSENRELREKLYRGYFMRGNNQNDNDNKKIILETVTLRAQRAKLLGYDNHAEFVISDNMAKTPDNVYGFLYKLWKPAVARANQEISEMQAIINKEGGNFKLDLWDWWYYAEKLRKEKYDLDEKELKPYLKLENVRDGMYWVANRLYGITFTKLDNIPVYHPDVEVFEVKENDGSFIGLFYCDYFPRAGKSVGAWCTSFRSGSYDENGNRIYPIVSIVCNFTKPTTELPSLLTWDETETLFHEFGHALHGLFTDGLYRRTAGDVPRDFVELPSQVMENWAAEPEVLKHYARHYLTDEPMPDDLIEKIVKSGHFNQGFNTTEYLAASILDLDWHIIKEDTVIDDVLVFEKNSMDKIKLPKEILPRYRSTYFAHIFESIGYSAGYYVYYWAAQLDADAFNAFKESGDLFNQKLAADFRKFCLSECGEDEGMIQYVKFRGKEPVIEPLLERTGLK